MPPTCPPCPSTLSPVRERVRALTVALLVVGLGVFVARTVVWPAWVTGSTGPGLGLMLVVLVVVAVLAFVGRGTEFRPLRLAVRPGRFVAGPAGCPRADRLLRASAHLSCGAAMFLPSMLDPALPIGLRAFGVSLVVAVTAVAHGPRPRMVLTRTGVEVTSRLRTRRAAWADIEQVHHNPSIRVRGRWWVGDGQVDVWPGYTARAIRVYLAHPERRPLIGTAAEHDRLHAELSAETRLCAARNGARPRRAPS
ncbi:hypothetical protein AB0M43_00980 [Longispora sp. NPDC051575]|uniref:PH domain-containing protein n=1 Tax=Longispora sp. NPDC051575 TaxID=3154943 RepID=UPI0034456879